jgi:hypothetical protein
MDGMTPEWAWAFFPIGYLLTVLIETPILWVGLSSRHDARRRLTAGLWLTACTYPIVVLVLPLAMRDYSRGAYLTVAETFAPLAECALFYVTFLAGTQPSDRRATLRDCGAIVAANLASFLAGEVIGRWYLGV